MQEHYHRCKRCELMFGCFCDDQGRLFGQCPQCDGHRGGLSLLGAVALVAAVIIWVFSSWR